MEVSKAITEVMRLRGYTLAQLAREIGSTPSTLSDNLNRRRKGMRTDTLLAILEEMNCELVIRSKLKDKTEYIVSASGEEGEESK